MALSLVLAPPGAGKTAEALRRVEDAARIRPFARIWVLVSGARQEDAFRERLADRAGPGGVFFNVEFFTFYELYRRLLNIAGKPPRRLDDTARAALLRAILDELQQQGALQVYDRIATTPGFVRIAADFIYELKQNGVLPQTYERAAAESGRAKDADLARIYAAYQARLVAHNLVDRDGEGWVALEVLEAGGVPLQLDLLAVDGYDEFTPLQARLLLALSAHTAETLITLATAPGRESTGGRRYARARAELERAAAARGVVPRLTTLYGEGPQRNPALGRLLEQVFRLDAVPSPSDGAVTLIEAPDPAREAAAVLRRVKRLLLDGCPPDDILIALRDWPRYADHFAALGQAYGVPLALHFSDPLARNPAVVALLQALELPASNFRRRDLLDVLRTPYLAVPGLDAARVDLLEQISQTFAVTGGRALWLRAIETAAAAPAAEDTEGEPEAHQALITPDEAADLGAALRAFFDAVMPPDRGSVAAYVRWLDTLIGQDVDAEADEDGPQGYSFSIPAQVRRESAPGIVERDLAALVRLKRALRGLLAARDLIGALAGDADLDAAAFMSEFLAAMAAALVERGPGRARRVLVTTVTDARGLSHRHIFIPGLSEGIFPAASPEDPLYLDTERQALSAAGVPLETAAERASDDGLFYQLVGQARESLTLSRPAYQDGAPWIASHLWRSAAQVLTDAPAIIQANRSAPGMVAGPGEAASPAEAALAAAAALSADTAAADGAALYNWLRVADAPGWMRIHRARQVELGRMSRRRAHDRYSGRLHDMRLIAYAAAALGPERVWSASQFNDFGMCGFRFFAKRLLRLEALEEPEDALNAATLGSITHEILENTYGEVLKRGLAIVADNGDEALDILREKAAPVLAHAPQHYRFAADARWTQEQNSIMQRMEALVRKDFSDESPAHKVSTAVRHPYRLEAALRAEIAVSLDSQPERLRVSGFIDRMDSTEGGVIVIDYKTGSRTIPVKAMIEGRNFQMMVYLLAAQQLLDSQQGDGAPRRVIGGLFWHTRRQQVSGDMKLDDDGLAALEAGQAHLGRYIAAGRRGDFSVAPRKLDNGRCASYCEYAQLCRVASTSLRKPEAT